MVDIIEGYETEEQQVEAIKGWWKKNGNTLVISAVVGLAGLWGWRYYNESVTTAHESTSQAFSEMQTKFAAETGEKDLQVISDFVAENNDNTYGLLASLLLAKEAVEQHKYDLAKTQLQQAQKQNSYKPLNPVINLRLARVESELGDNDAALATLALITEKPFLARAEQLKGNVYLQMGDQDKARSAFQDAINNSQGRVDPVLQLQADDLGLSEPKIATEPVLDGE